MPPKKNAKKAVIASPKSKTATPASQAASPTPSSKDKSASQQPAVPKKGAKKKATPAAPGKSHSDGILEALLSGAAVASTVDSVLHVHQNESAESASCAVVNMVCKAACVKEVEIDVDIITQESAIAATLEEMFARVPADSDMCYLNNKDAKYRRFKKTFPDFFQRLVLSAAAADVLYDEGGLTAAVPWLAAMSTSKARSFRLTATQALLSIIEGMGSRVAMLKDSLQSQKKKDATQTQKTLDKLLELHDSIFNGLVQRSKDVAPEIRILFTTALKTLCTKFPAQYISNNYLRCFAVSFYDKKSECRVEGYTALVEILGGVPEHADSMRDFFKYFAKRIVETCNDADTKVADLAIRLCSLLIRRDVAGDDLITTDMLDHILLGLFDERSIIRSSTGTFFKIHLRTQAAAAGDVEGAVGRQTELLCAFLATLHEMQHEPLAERYVVDALWRADNPPQVLTSYAPLITIVKSGPSRDVAMALRLLSAILQRIREPLSFGPAAKDDVRQPAAKVPGKKADDLEELVTAISKDVATILAGVMDKHQDTEVFAAAAEVISQLDLSTLTSQKLSSSVRDMTIALRKGSAVVEDIEYVSARVLAAWRALAFTEHPNKSEAEGQLHELIKQVLKQLSAAEKPHGRGRTVANAPSETDAVNVWARVKIITSLVALKDQWVIFKSALTQHTLANSPAQLLANLVAVAFQGLIWLVGEAQIDASVDPASITTQMTDVAAMLVKILEMESPDDERQDDHLHLKVNVFVHLADLCSLPQCSLPQVEQEIMINSLFELVETCADKLKEAQESMKAIRPAVPQAVTRALLLSRKKCTAWEAAITKLSMSTVRLFVFKKISESFAPRVMLLWTKVSVRVASDCFKSLFHTLRDRTMDSFKLEKSVILAGYKHCADVGMNPAALEAFYQIGMKLASMHFLLTDKYYSSCLAIVRFGVEYATTTDPAILQAVQPYCSKLRQSDALNVVNSLNSNDLFSTPTNPFIRSFISAIRRAAKMEEAAPFSGAPTPARASKRTREPPNRSEQQQQLPPPVQDDLLAEVVSKAGRKSYAGSGAAPKSSAQLAARVVTEDGWRVKRDAPPPKPSQTSQRGKRTLTTGTQLSSLVDDLDDNEVFIATQEYV
jgi:cohesin complex subunit SA-1/2